MDKKLHQSLEFSDSLLILIIFILLKLRKHILKIIVILGSKTHRDPPNYRC